MPSQDAAPKRKRILVIDQDDWSRDFFSSVIKMMGAEFKLVSTVEEANIVIEEMTFDLVITDLRLPESRHLVERCRHRFPTVRILVMAPPRIQPDPFFFLDMVDLIPKPVNFDDIIRKIRHAMHQMDLQETEEQFRRLKKEAFRLLF